MSSPAPSQASRFVLDMVESLIAGATPRDVLLVGPEAAMLASGLRGHGVDSTTADGTTDTGRKWDAVAILDLGADGSKRLREIGGALTDESVVVVSSPSAVTGPGLRTLIERGGLLVEDLRCIGADGEVDRDEDADTFVARCVPHRAAAQVASARRRMGELVAERAGLLDRLAASEQARRDEVAELEAQVHVLRAEAAGQDAAVAELTESLSDARQRAERRERQRDRVKAERDELRRTVDALQSRRALRFANRVGRLARRRR